MTVRNELRAVAGLFAALVILAVSLGSERLALRIESALLGDTQYRSGRIDQ